jgi:hypothetical protein
MVRNTIDETGGDVDEDAGAVYEAGDCSKLKGLGEG